jgi:hypothetical protein
MSNSHERFLNREVSIMRFSFGLLVVSLFVTIVPHASGDEVNIALKAEVEVSSIFADNYGGENAIDGNNDQMNSATRWLSSKDEEPPMWLTLDFGKPMAIDKVELYFHCQHTDFGIQCWGPVEYVLQYEKDGKWMDIPGTQVKEGKRGDQVEGENSVHEYEFLPYIGARRLRFYCTDACSYDTSFGNIIRMTEIEVYSSGEAEYIGLFGGEAVNAKGKLTTSWGNIKLAGSW